MPETRKLRRRQLYLGVVVLVLAIVTVTQGVYSRVQDGKQRDCIEDVVAGITQTQIVRAEINELASAATRDLLTGLAGDLTPEQTRSAYRQYVATMAEVDQARADNPVPPYPAGTCEPGTP